MPLGRVLMMLGLMLPLVGLIYGMSGLNGGDAKTAMFTELTCLAGGVAIFMLGHGMEKKRGDG